MAEAFMTGLWETSLAVAVLIAALLALTPALGKLYSAKWRYWAWLILALRLMIPYNFELAAAPVRIELPAREKAAHAVLAQDSENEHAAPVLSTPTQGAAAPGDSAVLAPPPENSASPLDFYGAAFTVWAVGAAACLLWQLAGYARFLRYVRRWSRPVQSERVRAAFAKLALQTRANVRLTVALCPGLASPMATGLLRPVLLLPTEDYEAGELENILRHELVHCARGDIAYKLLLMLATAAHWFDPLVWLMARAANRDLEIACDEAVTHGMDREARARYGEAILSVVRRGGALAPAFSTYFYGGKDTIAKRLKGIFDTDTKRRGALALAVVLLLAAAAGALVACGPKAEGPAAEDGSSSSVSEAEPSQSSSVPESEPVPGPSEASPQSAAESHATESAPPAEAGSGAQGVPAVWPAYKFYITPDYSDINAWRKAEKFPDKYDKGNEDELQNALAGLSFLLSEGPDEIVIYDRDAPGTRTLTARDITRLTLKLEGLEPEPFVKSPGNPPTGGGWQIWISSKSGSCEVGYSGNWLTIGTSGAEQGYIFDAETATRDCGIDDLIWELGGGAAYAADFYRAEKVSALYAYNEAGRAYCPVEGFLWGDVLGGLDDFEPGAGDSRDGFLIVTDKGKYSVKLGEKNSRYLTALRGYTAENSPKLAQWLAYMDPAKVTAVRYQGDLTEEDTRVYGQNVGWDSARAARDPEYDAETVAAEMLKAAQFMQGNMATAGFLGKFTGEDNPVMTYSSKWAMELDFSTGVTYKLRFDEDYLSIYASDLGYSLGYRVKKETGMAVAKLMGTLTTAEADPYTG